MSVPIAILGPTGYTGLELIEILARHPGMHAAYLGTARDTQPRIDSEFPRLAGRLGQTLAQCEKIDHDEIARRAKLAFLCLPHEAAMKHTPALLSRGVKVVDLSAAYRIKDANIYAKAYAHAHTDPAGLAVAVYGLPEFARDSVRDCTLCANPGCYPTAAALGIVPLLREGLVNAASVIINAASGVSGAGREPKAHTTLVEAGENFSTYSIGTHRHQPEMAQSLTTFGGHGLRGRPCLPLFVPHLLPIERGILATIYAIPASGDVTTDAVMTALHNAFANEPFVRVRDAAPTLHDVQRTNMCHVNARVVDGRIVVVSAIDNLTKGASGQAVQNANLMLGRDEAEGLI